MSFRSFEKLALSSGTLWYVEKFDTRREIEIMSGKRRGCD